jgi:outer membrane protein OmpA-like peptidoglycan-associated protein
MLFVVVASFAMTVRAESGGEADKDDGSDHPLITRYAESTVYAYGGETYGAARTLVANKGKPAERIAEGKITSRLYQAPKGASSFEVFRNYQAALRNAGFSILYECETARCEKDATQYKIARWPQSARWLNIKKDDYHLIRMFESKPGFHYIHASKSGANGDVDVQIALSSGDVGDKTTESRVWQFVQVVEAAAVDQGKVIVDAAAIGNALRHDGRIALYGVLFDTNQAVIKPESKAALEQMAKSLADDPSLNVYIVGHTDNQGAIETNLALSRKRAQAVASALSDHYGIAAARLYPYGVANLAPVAANTAEAGRARNRRVEMVVR